MNNCCKSTLRTDVERKNLINRLSRIEGQIRGLKLMIEKDAYCLDILVQSAAASAAINSFNKELMASHIKGCVVRDIQKGNTDTVDELVIMLERLMK